MAWHLEDNNEAFWIQLTSCNQTHLHHYRPERPQQATHSSSYQLKAERFFTDSFSLSPIFDLVSMLPTNKNVSFQNIWRIY